MQEGADRLTNTLAPCLKVFKGLKGLKDGEGKTLSLLAFEPASPENVYLEFVQHK